MQNRDKLKKELIGEKPTMADLFAFLIAETQYDDKTENKYNPSQPRDKDGQWSDGGGSVGGSDVGSTVSGKMVMTEAQAKEATKNSKYKELLYHGTLDKNARSIAETGFDSKKNRDDTLFGKGTYMTPEYMDARTYSFAGSSLDKENVPRVIKSYIDVKNPYVASYGENAITQAVDKVTGKKGYKVDNDGYPTNIPEFIAYQKEYSKQVNKILETHDAVVIESGAAGANPMVVVRDPESIKIFRIEHANEGMR